MAVEEYEEPYGATPGSVRDNDYASDEEASEGASPSQSPDQDDSEPDDAEDGTPLEDFGDGVLMDDEFDADGFAFGASLSGGNHGGELGMMADGYRIDGGRVEQDLAHDALPDPELAEDGLLNGYTYGDAAEIDEEGEIEDDEDEDEDDVADPRILPLEDGGDSFTLDASNLLNDFLSSDPAPALPELPGGQLSAKPYSNALADALRQASDASSYWSKRNDLGFGQSEAEEKRRKMALPELESEDAEDIHGAPMENPFFMPTSADGDETVLNPIFQALDPSSAANGSARGRGRGRGGGVAGRGPGRPRGGIAWALRGTEHDPARARAEAQAQKRARGRPERQRGRRRGRRRIDPGPGFKHHQTLAMSAYMDGDLQVAITHVQSAIKANPEVGIAHWLLSEVLRQLGREKDSLGALLSGALIQRDAKMWIEAGDRTLQLAEEWLRPEAVQQAMYCYSHALHFSQKDSDLALMARAGFRDTLIESGDHNAARLHSKGICRLDRANFDNIMLYAELCAETNDTGEILRAKIAYENAFEATSVKLENLNDIPDAWSHVNVYMDLLDKLRYTSEAIRMLKRLARWILGRKDEQFWDKVHDDDREYDSGNERRAFVGEFQQGKASREKERYGDGLPLEIRVKMGVFRLKMGMTQHEEALRHLEHLLKPAVDAADYYDLMYHVADILRQHRVFAAAINFYERLTSVMEGANQDFSIGLAECYENVKRHPDAEDTYRALIRADPLNVQARVKLANMYDGLGWHDEAVPLLKEVMELGRKNIVQDEPLPSPPPAKRRRTEKPLKPKPLKPNGVVQSSKAPTLGPMQRSYAPIAASAVSQPSPTPAPRRKRGPVSTVTSTFGIAPSDVVTCYNRLQDLWPTVESGDQAATKQWMRQAERLIANFRGETAFMRKSRFTGYAKAAYGSHLANDPKTANSEREAFDMLTRLDPEGQHAKPADQSTPVAKTLMVPLDFHGLLFSQWHRLISDLVLLYAEHGDQDHCYPLLKDVLVQANVFRQDATLLNTGYAVALSCALQFNDSEYAANIARWYINKSDLRASTPYQLLGSVTRLCYGEDNALHSGDTQKFMARAVKAMDHILMPPTLRDRIYWPPDIISRVKPRLARYGQGNGVHDPGVFMLFGHIMMAVSHHTMNAALPWYLRALALQPENASINFAIGVTYIHQSMKRQTDNRQYGIQQGLAFIQRYYELRIRGGEVRFVQEAEFNVARTWHILGLTHLAIPGYEKVLAMGGEVKAVGGSAGEDEDEDGCEGEGFEREAAYALQQMFALAGNEEAAVAITEQYLVI